jgi:tRNA(adenine34) deaminase
MLDHEQFMGIALDLAIKAGARGNRPVGSLVVSAKGEILGKGANQVFSDFDPTSHAEINAIRQATTTHESVDIAGCTVYSSLEPCPMCCWAIVQSNATRLVLGGRHAALGRKDLGSYSVEALLALTGRSLELVTGVRSKDSEDLWRAWHEKRAAKRGS